MKPLRWSLVLFPQYMSYCSGVIEDPSGRAQHVVVFSCCGIPFYVRSASC